MEKVAIYIIFIFIVAIHQMIYYNYIFYSTHSLISMMTSLLYHSISYVYSSLIYFNSMIAMILLITGIIIYSIFIIIIYYPYLYRIIWILDEMLTQICSFAYVDQTLKSIWGNLSFFNFFWLILRMKDFFLNFIFP